MPFSRAEASATVNVSEAPTPPPPIPPPIPWWLIALAAAGVAAGLIGYIAYTQLGKG